MRIAVLVHSAVRNDARITKEAMSLRAAGHDVVIHGIAPDGRRHRELLPGSDVPLWLEPRVSRVGQWRRRGLLLGVVLTAALLVLGVAAHILALSGQQLVLSALVAGGFALAAAWPARHRLARMAQHLDDFVASRWRLVVSSA